MRSETFPGQIATVEIYVFGKFSGQSGTIALYPGLIRANSGQLPYTWVISGTITLYPGHLRPIRDNRHILGTFAVQLPYI